ncbi:MAG: hypothetical protein ACLFPX_01575 [Candidatus Omnitrophota bacterium]
MVIWPQDVRAGWKSLRGFGEFAYGQRFHDSLTKREEFTMLETRLQLETGYYFDGESYLAEKRGVFNVRGDLLYDFYFSETAVDMRELALEFTPWSFMDVKVGRQILTWGTGDYLFVNDLFPKDYVSFFIGRDDEYLKEPSNAVKASMFFDAANVDLVAIPDFEPNAMPEGDRLSFFDSFQNGIAGRESDRSIIEPARQFSNTEYAARIYRTIDSHEYALYYFRGFSKAPRSYKDQAARELKYRRIDAYGASVRGAFAGGIGNLEAGYYYSREDPDGTNRLIENSLAKYLAGYTKDLGNDLQVGFQYLFEQRLDYSEYISNLLPEDYYWDEYRHVVTNRITKQFNRQTVTLNVFTFFSPSDRDGYFRPTLAYDVTDNWKVTVGASIFWGPDDQTEFAQMKRNKNVFFRVRYSF